MPTSVILNKHLPYFVMKFVYTIKLRKFILSEKMVTVKLLRHAF